MQFIFANVLVAIMLQAVVVDMGDTTDRNGTFDVGASGCVISPFFHLNNMTTFACYGAGYGTFKRIGGAFKNSLKSCGDGHNEDELPHDAQESTRQARAKKCNNNNPLGYQFRESVPFGRDIQTFNQSNANIYVSGG